MTSTVEKLELARHLRALGMLDQSSPFIGLQLLLEQSPKFYRSGAVGYMRSVEAVNSEPWLWVSLGHLQDRLRVLLDAHVVLSNDKGVLKIQSTQTDFETELRVYTVAQESAGIKSHSVGKPTTELPPQLFHGFDCRTFTLAAAPVIEDARVMLPLREAIVVWQGPEALRTVTLYPRQTLLNAVSGQEPRCLTLTDGGYWKTEIDGNFLFVSGHQIGKPLYDAYNVQGETKAILPAKRLVETLRAAAMLCEGDNDKVTVDPKQGILSQDKFGNVSRFAILPGEWERFSIFGKTARTIVEAFAQTSEDEATLSEIHVGSQPTMRLQRGPWTVNFKTF